MFGASLDLFPDILPNVVLTQLSPIHILHANVGVLQSHRMVLFDK
jgi:hypothetical protein